MDEAVKYRREVTFRVLAWGTFVLLVVWGYSLTQSDLFELRDPAPEETQLEIAKYNQAEQLIREAGAANTSISARSKVEAAQIQLDVYLAKEVREDRKRRAVGLIIGAFVYCLVYPVAVWFVYKRAEAGTGAAEKDVLPQTLALLYAIGMSVSTFCTAFLTAYY